MVGMQTIGQYFLGFPGFDKWDKIKYLGLPLTLGPSPPSLQLEVISKIKAKIISRGVQSLTKVGKLILIKAVLSSLPIFHSFLLLDPKSILSHISKILMDFLWEGGKGNQNKMHLVSWDILKRSTSEGGLQIHDPELENLALGGKFIQQLYADKNHLVSKIFWMKYLKDGSLRNLKTANTPTCTIIWNLCRRGIDNIHHQLYRIPGNGKRILLWGDKILGNLPVAGAIFFPIF